MAFLHEDELDRLGRRRWKIGPVALVCIIGIIVFVFLCILGAAGCKEYNRYQKRQDAKNRTLIVKQEIKTAEQQAQVNRAQIAATRAEAQKRFVEATGIRRAQDEISATLTPLYVQHEAIEAMKNSAQYGGQTIYIPAGQQGVPLVADVGDKALGDNRSP